MGLDADAGAGACADAIQGGDRGKISPIRCSICLDDVTDDGKRSWAKLLCGHQFHLDCIGSAFNVKGIMQCPNCRKTEKGQWLYANVPPPPIYDPGMDDWVQDDEFYDPSYTEMILGINWCPPPGLASFPSSYDERRDVSPETYYEAGPQAAAVYADLQAMAASLSHHHACPYVTYLRPPSSNPGRSSNVPDTVNNNNNLWSCPPPPIHNEVPTSYTFPAMDIHYQNWDHPSSSSFPSSSSISHVGAGGGSDQSIASLSHRPPSHALPFPVGHSTTRAGTSGTSSAMIPSYPSSVARTRDRVQALQAYSQPPSSTRSSSDLRAALPSSSADQTAAAGFYYFPSSRTFQAAAADNHHPSGWTGPPHRSGSDSGVMRSNGFHHRHGS